MSSAKRGQKLPVGMEESALWWDVKLVNEARQYSVQVVGVEGKSLAYGQYEPQYKQGSRGLHGHSN